MDWLGFLPVILRSSTSHPRLNPLLVSGRVSVYTGGPVSIRRRSRDRSYGTPARPV